MTSDRMSFHFPQDIVPFLADLKANNTKLWFAENKARYEAAIKGPAQEFCDHMQEMFADRTGIVHRSRIFRIHRDLRFSKDKTPYNTHLHISFSPLEECQTGPIWFFGLEEDQLTLGCGLFAFPKDQLEAYRVALLDGRGEALLEILAVLKGQGGRMLEADLKRLPRGFEADHPCASLALYKGLSMWLDMEPSIASQPGLISRLEEKTDDLQPLYDWLLALGAE
ncbi:MAG: DUF2461 domain-containing protein [Cohaesibacter sp.]|nr:DUF2461 domain-containing protein [Cohaesibacter sp.]